MGDVKRTRFPVGTRQFSKPNFKWHQKRRGTLTFHLYDGETAKMSFQDAKLINISRLKLCCMILLRVEFKLNLVNSAHDS